MKKSTRHKRNVWSYKGYKTNRRINLRRGNYYFKFAPFVITKRQYKKANALHRCYKKTGKISAKTAFLHRVTHFLYQYSTKTFYNY